MAEKVEIGSFRHNLQFFEFVDLPDATVETVRLHKKVLDVSGAVKPLRPNRYWGAVIGQQDERSASHQLTIRFPCMAIDSTMRVIIDGARLFRVHSVENENERNRFLFVFASEERDIRTEAEKIEGKKKAEGTEKPFIY